MSESIYVEIKCDKCGAVMEMRREDVRIEGKYATIKQPVCRVCGGIKRNSCPLCGKRSGAFKVLEVGVDR